MKKLIYILSFAIVLGFITLGNATLWDRGGGLIYDDYLNITWLQDANYAKTSGYDADGRMNWAEATTWAANLVYDGYSDWRLPKTVEGPLIWSNDGTTAYGMNITSSEMGYMYYMNLANKGYCDSSGNCPQSGWSEIPNNSFESGGPGGPAESFQNLQVYYWSGTEYSGTDYWAAWVFHFNTGAQGIDYKDTDHVAVWAVRDGDSVPEPGTMLLLGLGLMGLAGVRRKFKK